MATPIRGILGSVTERLITIEDALAPGNPWRDCEIWDGVAVVCEPSGGRAGFVGANILAPLTLHVRKLGVGWTFTAEQGFVLARDPDRLLAADVSFVAKDRLGEVPERGFIEVAPDFCVEVRSPSDAWEKTVHKCGIWVAHGVKVAWAVDPLTRTVAILRGDSDPVVLRGEGSASAEPALPDFALPLGDIFLP